MSLSVFLILQLDSFGTSFVLSIFTACSAKLPTIEMMSFKNSTLYF